MIFERALRPVLFRAGRGDAETAHEKTLRALAALAARPAALAALHARYGVRAPRRVFGIEFPHPVGLAAGMDKDGVALPAWPALGFGFTEAGTVTWHAQPGNDRPRLFREPAREAIVNRMGFNNRGARALAERLRAAPPRRTPLGISLGKSRVTPLAEAVDDYVASFKALCAYGDYFVVNVSSPNTPGLRALQDREHLDALLAALCTGERPILVKIAPDLTEHAIADLLGVCVDRGAAGVIATNTTATATGGLSGRPLADRAREVVAFVAGRCDLPVIGVGGITDVTAARRMFDAGASLVQLYTGFVYHGPALVRQIARAVREGRPRVVTR
jgi:dihydroorotate dehydrogenase